MEKSKIIFALAVVATISILLLVIVLSIVFTRYVPNKDNETDNSLSRSTMNGSDVFEDPVTNLTLPSELGLRNPDGTNMSMSIFPKITQHAILFEAIMDCEKVYSPSNMFMRVQCGNNNPFDIKEAIQFESSSSNVDCMKTRKTLLCRANIRGSVTRFATVFTCGKDHSIDGETQDPSEVQIYPVIGTNCHSAPKVALSYTRLCNNTVQDPNSWSLQPAMDGMESCPMNKIRQNGEWSLCESVGQCSSGKFPCTGNASVASIVAFDNIDDDRCVNPGGNITRYKSMDLPLIWKQISSIFNEWNNVTV
jgi:hypothetical protein